MFVNFESLDNASKVWIYQANRELSSHEGEIIKRTGKEENKIGFQIQ